MSQLDENVETTGQGKLTAEVLERITVQISKELGLSLKQVRTTVGLLNEGTPFRLSLVIVRK